MISIKEYADILEYIHEKSAKQPKVITKVHSRYDVETDTIESILLNVVSTDYTAMSNDSKYGEKYTESISFRYEDCTVEKIKERIDSLYSEV